MSRLKAKFLYAAVSAILLGMPSAQAQQSQYRIAPGETIEISILPVFSEPRRLAVQADGTIAINEAGSIAVAGLTPTELQSKLETVMTSRLFRVRNAAGDIQTVTLEPGDIAASVVSYRPVFVSGAVLTPGEHGYQPAMTTSQIIAAAGGYSQAIGVNTVRAGTDVIELKRNYELASGRLLKEHVHRQRLVAEIEGQDTFSPQVPPRMSLPSVAIETVSNAEMDALKLSLEQRANQETYLEQAIAAATDQIDTLERREKVEAETQKADEDDMKKIAGLLKTGDTSNSRMAEVRRNLMFSSTRRLSTLVELLRVRNQRAELVQQIETNKSQTRLSLLNEMKDVDARVAEAEVQLKSAEAQLQSAGETAVIPSSIAPKPQISILRMIGGNLSSLTATSSTEILPGDVVKVAMCQPEELSSNECPALEAHLQ